MKLTHSYFRHVSSSPPRTDTVANSLDEMAAQYPNHVCYIFKAEKKNYTYATFKAETDRVASGLLKLGFQANDHLGIFLPNSSENVILTYVASKIGLVRVHINPLGTARELANALNKTSCKGIVLTSNDAALSTLRHALPDLNQLPSLKSVPSLQHIIIVGSNKTTTIPNSHSYNGLLLGDDAPHDYQSSVDPNSPLSIFLTSGSTGEPKAAVLTNASVFNLLVAIWTHFGSLCERCCAGLSMFHVSSSVWITLLPAVRKSTIVVPDLITNPEAIMRAIDEEKCTFFNSGSTLLRRILAHPDRQNYNLTSLRYVAVGSTAIQPQFLRTIECELGVARTGQLYGMTEAGPLTDTIYCEDDRRYTSIGQCMPFVEIKIVDDEGRIVPIHVVGEICAKNSFMMRGYYEDLQKTKETIDCDGWFRTGDMGSMDEDGYMYFTGRKKEMIILGGRNIWPVEIEQAILEHHSVVEAYVFGIPDPLEDEAVCASVKLHPGMECDIDKLKSFLRQSLSEYKVPTHIHFVDDFERSSIGKISKAELAQRMIEKLKQ